MEQYSAIAAVYDRLNDELDYASWADFIEGLFSRFGVSKGALVLDLCCGTGRMTEELARRGYDMTGVDLSEEMLAEATEKARHAGLDILYLCQDMRDFELYGSVGAVVSCLDSLNYLTSTKDLAKTFALVHNYLDPNGLFVFDMNTPHRLREEYGERCYVLEDDGVYCGWRNVYHPKTGCCDFYLTVFTENEDGTYTRSDEAQRERAYARRTIEGLLEKAGFEVVYVSGGYGGEAPRETDERWYFAARKK